MRFSLPLALGRLVETGGLSAFHEREPSPRDSGRLHWS